MEAFTIKDLTFTYPGRECPAVSNVSLSIKKGEFVLLCGKSGCGKTTLLRNLKSVLTPYGERTGEILYRGMPLDEISEREQAASIGFVLQDPDNQIVTDKVMHELAFGLESLGMGDRSIRTRIAETANYFGLQERINDKVCDLSGGSRQLLALAAVAAMRPDVLILDEPASQLDPSAAADLFDMLKKINRDTGVTVIISEHRLDEVMHAADRLIVMEDGRIAADAPPEEACRTVAEQRGGMFLSMPSPVRTYAMLAERGIGRELECPTDPRKGRDYLDTLLGGKEIIEREPARSGRNAAIESSVKLKNVWFRYERDKADILRGLDLDAGKGEIYSIVGANGVGKTTALNVICGNIIPYRGRVTARGRIAMLPQDVTAVFGSDTVEKDLMHAFDGGGVTRREAAEKIKEASEITETDGLLQCHPYDLSGGERQRAALAKILLIDPDIILLDEPTKGMDNDLKDRLAGVLKRLARKGRTVIIVSHDIEFCAKYSDRCGMFFNGMITAEGEPGSFFGGNSFYTTSASRMSRHIFDNAVTAEDVAELVIENLCPGGGSPVDHDGDVDPGVQNDCDGGHVHKGGVPAAVVERAEQAAVLNCCREEGARKKRPAGKAVRIAAGAATLILAASTILMGIKFGHSRSYYIVSMLIVFYAQIPFFLMFERRKPREREIVVTAVLITLGVIGNAAFFMTPEIKPSAAIAIIAGACLGPETGFIVGSMIPFVTNFMFGQGPWTPWQMLAMGLAGLIAGLIFRKRGAEDAGPAMYVYGFIAAFAIYGGIVDLQTVLALTPEPTTATLIAVYGAAIPVNLVFGIATVIFLVLLSGPMMRKIERVKVKYGLMAGQ